MIQDQTIKRAVLHALSAYNNRREGLPAPQPPALWGLRTDATGRLAWDGCALEDLACRFGTPLHVVSFSQLEKNYRSFREAFASRYPLVEVGYSYKTNPLPGVIRALHGFGAAAEVISHFELWLALRLGVPPGRIIFNGPAKTPEALDLAVRSGIKIINIDGPAEIARIDERAAHYGVKQRVGVRIITSVGWSSQFGFKVDDGAALDAFRKIKACRNLVPCGLHLHLGTGLRDAALYFQSTREALDLALRLGEMGISIEHFDLGGGFNIPTVRELSSLDMKFLDHGFQVRPPRPGASPAPAQYAEGIVSLMEKYLARDAGPAPEIILEPGRALSSSAQCLLLTVLSVKQRGAEGKMAIVDGGRNLSMPLAYEYHEVMSAGRARPSPRERYTLYGPLCHPHDVVAQHRDLPRLSPGDVLAVMDSGAYFIPNQMNFSNPRPAVVMVASGAPEVIRARESFEDVVRLDGLV